MEIHISGLGAAVNSELALVIQLPHRFSFARLTDIETAFGVLKNLPCLCMSPFLSTAPGFEAYITSDTC